MRLLFIHSDHLEFEVTEQAGPDEFAETEGVPMGEAMEECATVFISVESEDEAAIDAAVANAVTELEDVTDQLNTYSIETIQGRSGFSHADIHRRINNIITKFSEQGLNAASASHHLKQPQDVFPVHGSASHG